MPEPAPTPEVRTGAWFDGVLIGTIEELGELERAVADFNAAGMAQARLEVDGGRFSLLLDDRRLPVDAGREPAIRALVVRVASDGRSVTEDLVVDGRPFAEWNAAEKAKRK